MLNVNAGRLTNYEYFIFKNRENLELSSCNCALLHEKGWYKNLFIIHISSLNLFVLYKNHEKAYDINLKKRKVNFETIRQD